MKRSELIQLRKLVDEETKRRERIQELLRNELVREYLEIAKIKPLDLDNSLNEIINQILSSFTITETNGIYVCTSAWYSDFHICYEDTEYYSVDVDINSKRAEYKIYADIESGKKVKAIKEGSNSYGRTFPFINDFEKDNLVLNPYNNSENQNGYGEVRTEFFKEALKKGQPKSKMLILSKYPRM